MDYSIIPAASCRRFVCLAFFGILSGCHWGQQLPARSPAVTTRFTSSSMMPGPDGTMIPAPRPQPVSAGLAMQSSPEPAHMTFAAQLGTVLIRELQLSSGGFRVTPLAAIDLRSAVPALETNDSLDVITVSLQEPTSALPPQLPPSPYLDPATPPLVDQILVVRVLEYRAYYPMLATLELRVLNGNDQTEMFGTTVSWAGDDYQLENACCKPRKRFWFCKDPTCDPGPAHNSPQALMHEIAKDVTTWYCTSADPMSGQCIVLADSEITPTGPTSSGAAVPPSEDSLDAGDSNPTTVANPPSEKTTSWKRPKLASFRKSGQSKESTQTKNSNVSATKSP